MSYFKYLKKNLLFVSSFALFLTGSISLSLAPRNSEVQVRQKSYDFNVSLLPVITSVESYPYFSAYSIYAIDLDSSVVLYEKNPDERVFPASTAKIVTALVAMDSYEFGDVLNTGQFRTTGQKMGLVWYENISFENLLYGLLIHSGNDAAEVLASNYTGGRESFIAAMNKKARTLNANNTNFINPSGLDDNNQYTTARDLVNIAQVAMRNPIFAKIVATREHNAESTDGKFAYHLTNRNELLGKVDGVLGVKTGWTENARENLVTYIERDNRRIMIAILGSQDRFGETEELVEWIFANYKWVDVNSQSLVFESAHQQ